MILKKITIANIASLEYAVVDFTQGPLLNADLFLIHGETGSGKTTIIDAICLALFNNTPRLKSAPASKLTFGAYSLSSRDTANMLRHGATDAKAELEFVGNDDKAYTALWAAHATPKKINITHTLLHDGLEIAKGAQVGPMMRDSVIGMTFDDFCRTAVLAQGEFSKFLMSDDGTKAQILEKLTATEQFTEVGKTIYAIWKEKDEALKRLQLQMEGIQLLTMEEIQSIRQAVEQAQNELLDIDSKIKTLTSHHNWLTQKSTLGSHYEQAVQEYQQAEALCKDPNYIAETKLLADYDLSQQAIASLRTLQDSKSKSALADEKEKQLAIHFSEATAGLAYQHQQLRILEKDLESADSMIDMQMPHKDMFEKSAAVLAYLQHARQMIASANQEQAKQKDRSTKLTACEKAKESALKDKENAQREVDYKTHEISQKQKEIDALDAPAITQRTKDLQQLNNDLNQAGQSIQALFALIEKVEEAEHNISILQKDISDSTIQLNILFKEQESAQESYNQAEKAYRSVDLASTEWAIQARAILSDGDICPVCGNAYSAAKFNEVVARVKDAEESKLIEARANKAKAEKDYNAMNAAIDQKKKDLVKQQDKELPQMKNLLLSAFQKASADCDKVGIDLPDASRNSYQKALQLGQQKRTSLKKQQEDNTQDLNRLNDLNAGLKTLNDQLVPLNKALYVAVETVSKAQKDLDDCFKDIETAKQNIVNYTNQSSADIAAASAIITWPDWKNEWEHDPDAFEKRLKSAASDYRDALAQQAKLRPQIAQLQSQLDSYDSQCSALSLAHPQWTDSPADAQFSDRQADRWSTLTVEAAAVRQQKAAALNEMQKASRDLELFYAKHPTIDQEQLAVLKDFPATEIRQKHDHQDSRLAQLKGAVDLSKQNLDRHIDAKPADIDLDKDVAALAEEIATQGEKRELLSQAIGGYNQKLEADKQKQELYGKKQIEYDTQKVIRDKWTLFNDKYGDSTGSKFRRLAQQLIFDRLLQLANQHLARLTARYSLKTIPGTLTISLCDEYTPGYSSSVHNLSGGESFMVSLSLALALSSMGHVGITMDTLFIDEGFGTLSTNNQIRVMDLLQTLQRTQGKRVGIISHVPYLLERIPVQIKVTRNPADTTKSSISVLTATT